MLGPDGSETNLFVDGATGKVSKVASIAETVDDGDRNQGEDDNNDRGEG